MKSERYVTDLKFWVRNVQTFDGMNKHERAKNLHHQARNCLVYDYVKETIKFERCDNDDAEHKVVCERDLKSEY